MGFKWIRVISESCSTLWETGPPLLRAPICPALLVNNERTEVQVNKHCSPPVLQSHCAHLVHLLCGRSVAVVHHLVAQTAPERVHLVATASRTCCIHFKPSEPRWGGIAQMLMNPRVRSGSHYDGSPPAGGEDDWDCLHRASLLSPCLFTFLWATLPWLAATRQYL